MGVPYNVDRTIHGHDLKIEVLYDIFYSTKSPIDFFQSSSESTMATVSSKANLEDPFVMYT